MPWARWRSCVGGVVLLSLMGCAGQQFAGIFQAAGSGGSDYVVAGSANSVAASLEASLKRVGLSAVITEQGEDIRVASKTLKGDKFALVLTKVKNQQGESTRVRFEWENGPDEQIRTHVVTSLQAQSSAAVKVAQK